MTVRNDLSIYDRHAPEWWDGNARVFRSLRSVHRHRASVLARWLGQESPSAAPVLDVGSGGGFFSEELARQGWRVIGVDRSARSLDVAHRHAARERFASRPAYARADARGLPFGSATFRGVIVADVLEHLSDWRLAIAEAARVLESGGWLYVSTMDRTLRARLLAVWIAETLGVIPRGTHDPRLFIRPHELTAAAFSHGLRCEQQEGEGVRWWRSVRRWAVELKPARSLAVAYSLLLRKNRAAYA